MDDAVLRLLVAAGDEAPVAPVGGIQDDRHF